MITLTINDIRTRGSSAISDDEVSLLIVNSKPKAAMIPYEDYEMMIDLLEELDDIRVIEERKNDKTVPFEKVKKELLGEE